MNGSARLSDQEKKEMLEDAKNADRASIFYAARRSSEQGSLDDYIDFLSENVTLIDSLSDKSIPRFNDFRL